MRMREETAERREREGGRERGGRGKR